MNRVYKVIWSKAKHCYVVTSEIAKGYGKSAGSKGVKALLSGLVALSIAMGGYGLAGAVYVDSKAEKDSVYATAVYTQDEVYTKSETDKNFATKTDLDAKANAVDVANTYVNKTNAEVTFLTVDGDVEAHGNLKVGNGNFTVYGNTGDVTTGNATIGDALTVKGDTEMKGDLGVKGTLNAADGKFSVGNDGQLSVSSGKFIVDTNGGINIGHGTATIDNNGNITGKNLDVGNGDIKGGQITGAELNVSTGDIKGGQITGTGLNVGAGDIKGGKITGTELETGTLKTTVSAEIGGTLKAGEATVKSLDAGSGLIKTDGTVKAGDVQTGTLTTTGNVTIGGALTVTGKLNMDEIDMTKNGIVDDNNVTASTKVAAGEITSYKKATSTKAGGGEKESAIDYDEKGTSTWAKATDADGKWNKSSLTVEGKGIKSIATDGTNNASTNLSNNGFNTFASDGTNKTYTKQTATDIKNTAEKGMISHTAKNLVNTASENMTTTVGGNKSETVTGTSTETVTSKKTENYNGGLETTVTGDEKHTVNGSQINAITGSQTNTIGGSQTTTVTGDSSLTAENITNEAKNQITNKARDVETDAASSIVQKVTNDYGSNTSTQLSHQTTEEMKAEGKTASYLRGAAEEKSQLTDGAKKTTIDTVAGQTNTNITEGKNVSNSLQKADQIASSVTDGTNTTVVNQNAGSLASSITDGTKANNTSSTVDKSEQLIKVDNTHFYAETRTAGSAVEALKSDGNTIISAKDAVTGTVSSAVTDGATITGISQNAKDISLSAAGGTITNDANDVLNKGANSVINEVGDKQVAVMTDSVKAAYGLDTYTTWDDKGITNNAKDKTVETTAKDIKNTASNSITDKVGENVERTMGTKKIEESVKDGTKSNTFTKTAKKDMNIITDGTTTSTLSQLADSVNTSLKNGTQSLNNAKTVTEDVTKVTDENTGAFSSSSQKADSITSTVKDTEKGTISERSQTVSQVRDKVGTTTVTTTDGLTKLTNTEGSHKTEMDNANVLNNLSVGGNATVGKNLSVNGTSTLTGDVTMESNATVTKDLTVKGASEFVGRADFRNDVYMWGNLEVTGETRTDTLYVDHDGYVGGNLNVDGNIETHDAVLSADSRQVVTGRQLYQTNERVDRLDNRIKKVGANAAALAALRPGDFNPDDKFSIAAGFGSYRNANAAALGLFYRPNENVLLSLGTSFGDGENMVNAGVSVKFGRGKSMAERRKEMADEVSSMRDEMRSQDERIAELEEMLKKQSELIEKLSKES